MGLDDQVTCYSGTSARAVNHCDVSDRSMETEYERLKLHLNLLWGKKNLSVAHRSLEKDFSHNKKIIVH